MKFIGVVESHTAVLYLQQLRLGRYQIVMLLAEELVALFGLLVFLDGHEIYRADFIQPLLHRLHLLRHGEVHNPTGVLYGRLNGFRLSDLGRRQALTVAEHLRDHDITHVVASPLERAQETAAPIADSHRLELATDPRLIEAENYFEGKKVSIGDGALRSGGDIGSKSVSF